MKILKPKTTCSDSEGSGGGGDGASTFVELTDTPSNYFGQAGKVPVVKSNESGLEFEDFPSGLIAGVSWGGLQVPGRLLVKDRFLGNGGPR